ncbi:hypothetical protein Vretifemale_13701, partial [Volvox reticuliferus]
PILEHAGSSGGVGRAFDPFGADLASEPTPEQTHQPPSALPGTWKVAQKRHQLSGKLARTPAPGGHDQDGTNGIGSSATATQQYGSCDTSHYVATVQEANAATAVHHEHRTTSEARVGDACARRRPYGMSRPGEIDTEYDDEMYEQMYDYLEQHLSAQHASEQGVTMYDNHEYDNFVDGDAERGQVGLSGRTSGGWTKGTAATVADAKYDILAGGGGLEDEE